MADKVISDVARVAYAEPEEDRTSALVRLSRKRWFRRVVVWGGLLVIYQLLALWAGPFYLPTIQAIVEGGYQVIADGTINNLWSAFVHLVIGFALAIVIGIPVGVLMGSNALVDYVLGMYVRAWFVTSLVAVLPLLIILFGFELAFRVAVVFLFSVFFIILNTAAGVRDVDPGLQLMSRAFAIGRLKRAISISIPSSLPFIVTGLRLGLANAFTGMILAELWVTRGLGLDLTNLGANRDLPKYFALIIIVTALAAGAAALIKLAERRLVPWGNAAAGAM
jgi:ABC-type nitrate/sulfonate/bicarbonate transport system permease component